MAPGVVATVVATLGLVFLPGVAPSASADVAARDATESDLFVRSEQPSASEVERQFVAVWNPKIPFESKVKASFNGEKAKPALRRLFTPSPTHDYLTLSGRVVGPVKVGDGRASARIAGVMVGVPASTYTYHYRRDDGLWKFDWKRTCQELKCLGNPDFGY